MIEEIENKPEYPLVSDRYKAVFIDGLVMIMLIFLFSMIFSFFENIPIWVKMGAFVFSWALYEPICVSLFGASIGHMSGNLKVVRDRDMRSKLPIYLSIPRYIIKLVLGIISMFTVTKENKGRAIHDMVVSSMVVYNRKD